MLFGLFRGKGVVSKKSLPHSLQDYLNEADEEYMRSYNIRSTKGLQKYMTRDCLVKVGQSVLSTGTRYFGAEKFRTTKWELEAKEGSTLTIYKSVLFDKVRVGGTLMMAVADDYVEQWQVDVSKSKPLICDIKVVA